MYNVYIYVQVTLSPLSTRRSIIIIIMEESPDSYKEQIYDPLPSPMGPWVRDFEILTVQC